MNNDRAFLGTEPIGKLLFKLATPTVIAQIINMLYNIVDRIYIGHMPEVGSLALTGVGVCMPIIMLVSAFASLISSGGAPNASIYMGKGQPEKSEKILGGCFTVQVILSLIITAVLLIFNRSLLMTFGASENTIDYAVGYMNIYAIGTVFVQLTLGMNAFISGQGYSKVAMLTVIIGAATNIILDPVFIFAFGMGVRGAALATIISQCLSAVWCIVFLTGKKSFLRLKKENLGIDFSLILPCLALGSAAFVMHASESVITVCFNASALKYGGDVAVGAMTIGSTLIQGVLIPLSGLSQGAQPITSYNFGAKNTDRVRQSFRLLLKCAFVYSLAVWILMMLFPGLFMSIFTAEPALMEFGRKALRIFCGGVFMFGIQMACQMTFVATGNAKSSILVAVVRKFALLLPMIYLMPCILSDKVYAVFAAEPISDIIAVLFTMVLFSGQFKKALAALDAEKEN